MIRASQILFWFGLSIAASLALYHTSDRTREFEHQLRNIDAAIDAEHESIHVLKAEWVYLANPARVEAETKKHLALKPTAPKQVIGLGAIGDALPTTGEAVEQVTVSATPIASVETYVTPPPLPPQKIAAAAADHSHINSHMVFGKPARTASAQPSDQIGSLISTLGAHP